MEPNNKQLIVEKITNFIIDELGVADQSIDCNCNLFESGLIDSVRLEKLFHYVETSFGITLNEDCFFDERISSISGLSEIVTELIPA